MAKFFANKPANLFFLSFNSDVEGASAARGEAAGAGAGADCFLLSIAGCFCIFSNFTSFFSEIVSTFVENVVVFFKIPLGDLPIIGEVTGDGIIVSSNTSSWIVLHQSFGLNGGNLLLSFYFRWGGQGQDGFVFFFFIKEIDHHHHTLRGFARKFLGA
jgi:hypothetical protein